MLIALSKSLEVGINRKDFVKKERKHAFDQEKKVRYKKKERKHANDQEKN